EQGPGGLFGQTRRAARQRRDQVELSRHLAPRTAELPAHHSGHDTLPTGFTSPNGLPMMAATWCAMVGRGRSEDIALMQIGPDRPITSVGKANQNASRSNVAHSHASHIHGRNTRRT